MPQLNDLSRSLVALDQDSTIIAVVELSQSSWLVAGMLPGIERQPQKKLEPSAERLLGLLHRWRDEAVRAGKKITRIALAFEAGRDGFWLARWLNARGVEAHVIHPSSVAVSREHRRAKTDRLDTEMLKRGFLGWLRGERGHCTMARVPTIAEEDAKRPNRERECLVGERTRIVNRIKATLARLGIRNFKPTLRKAAERLAAVHTPEGMPLPPNTLAELQRDMARLGFVVSQIRERPGPPRHDPTRLALSDVSEGERAGIVVSRPHRRQPKWHAQDHDRRAGTQTGDCALALCHHWRDIGGRHPASGRLNAQTSIPLPARRSRWLQHDCRIDDPRWRDPVSEHGT